MMASTSPIASLGGDIFEVERILKKRHHPGRGILYHVKWKNFPSSANTWEPACNFSQKLIDEYENGRKRKVSRKSTPNNLLDNSTIASTTTTAASASSTETASTHQLTSSTQSPSSSFTISCSSLSTVSSTITASSFSQLYQRHRPKARPKRNSTLSRQQQVQLQMHIQQRQSSSYSPIGEQQLAVFNPVADQYLPPLEQQIVYQPKLTKEPIIVTDVTTKDHTVTISECKTQEGFFST